MFCPKCGKENENTASFCKYCGAKLSSDSTISFDQLNGGAGLERLKEEAKSAYTFSILAIVFSVLGGLLGLIFSFLASSKVNSANTFNYFPKDVSDLDEYELARAKLKKAGNLSKIALIIFVVSTILQLILSYVITLS